MYLTQTEGSGKGFLLQMMPELSCQGQQIFVSEEEDGWTSQFINIHVEREPGHGADEINMIGHSLSMLGKFDTFITCISVHQYSH